MAAATGATTGLVRAFTGGEGTSASHGTLQSGQPMSSVFSSTIISGHKTDEVRVTVADGNVTDVEARPAAGNRAGTRAAHRRSTAKAFSTR